MPMSPRENLIAALEGARPAWTPFTVYNYFVKFDEGGHDPAWDALFRSGLALVMHPGTVHWEWPGVEHIWSDTTWQGRPARRLILRTRHGEMTEIYADGWQQEFRLKTAADYACMAALVRDARLSLRPEHYLDLERRTEAFGLPLAYLGRSPLQTMLVDWAGLEAFSYHVADDWPQIEELASALEEKTLEAARLLASGPGRYVSLLENLTAEQWGPERFRCLHLPFYEKLCAVLHAAGKKVYAHFDGKTACLAPFMAQSSLDGIESLTEPPEGDQTLAQARAAWPDMFLWVNVNVSHYRLPAPRLAAHVRGLVRDGALGGRLLALEMSEDLPPNWHSAIPVVLEALKETNG